MGMAPYTYDEHGRRVVAPTKGEKREQAILDAAEAQLDQLGPDAMTVSTIATAAGITRGALYFYFRSKDDVIAALVRQMTAALLDEVDELADGDDQPPRELIRRLIDSALRITAEHGAIARAAAQLAPSVPTVREAWQAAADQTATTAAHIAVRAGLPDTPEPTGATAIARALVQLTERAFYETPREPAALQATAATLTEIWLRALRIDD
jgi:AcrR family transcriptional regulator